MDNKIININEEVKNKDKYKLNNTGMKGEIEILNDLGEVIFKKSNLILIPGRRFVLEKLFNVKSSDYTFPDLRKQLGIPDLPKNERIPESSMPVREKCVCLLSVGIGGSGLTLGDVYHPSYSDLKLKQPIPFKLVNADEDLNAEDKKKYFLRHEYVDNGVEKVAYYLKAFEGQTELKIKPLSTANVDGNQDWDVYAEATIKIEQTDLREYFESIKQLDKARINELGLVFGYQPTTIKDADYVDYAELEQFSAVSFNNEPLESSGKDLTIVYRVYA